MVLSLRPSGTSPASILMARPSTTAVFPTPGSPMRTGLFFVLLERICITCLISESLPITGSSLPSRHLDKVSAVFRKSLIVVFRILACDPLVASHLCELCEELVPGDAVAHEYTLARSSLFAEKSEVDVLHAHILVPELVPRCPRRS